MSQQSGEISSLHFRCCLMTISLAAGMVGASGSLNKSSQTISYNSYKDARLSRHGLYRGWRYFQIIWLWICNFPIFYNHKILINKLVFFPSENFHSPNEVNFPFRAVSRGQMYIYYMINVSLLEKLYICVCVFTHTLTHTYGILPVCIYVYHMHTHTSSGQKRMPEPPGL